jgi:hypothetical protein
MPPALPAPTPPVVDEQETLSFLADGRKVVTYGTYGTYVIHSHLR